MRQPYSNNPLTGTVLLQEERLPCDLVQSSYLDSLSVRDVEWERNIPWLTAFLNRESIDREEYKATIDQCVERLIATHEVHVQRENDEWRKKAIERLERSNEQFTRAIVGIERAELLKRGVVRGRRQ